MQTSQAEHHLPNDLGLGGSKVLLGAISSTVIACGGLVATSTNADAGLGPQGDVSVLDTRTDQTQDSARETDIDSSNFDATPTDASGPLDGSDADSLDASAVTYNDFTDLTHWSNATLQYMLDSGNTASHLGSYRGATFDGRYMYFAPIGWGGFTSATRYDTQGPFNELSSWQSFDTTTVDSNSPAYNGAVFDGRFVYLVPRASTPIRYDTQGVFTVASAWTSFDLSTVWSNAGYGGGTFDGRYIYYRGGPGFAIARYDTVAAFTDAGAWSQAPSTNVPIEGVGTVYDGRYIYCPPGNAQGNTRFTARHDTQSSFGDPSSWTTFDLALLEGNIPNFNGAAFDGRYVYFVPNGNVIARYDTQAAFDGVSAWAVFDTAAMGASVGDFQTAIFDGRYMYFVPSWKILVRYDTQANFADATSWSALDMYASNLGDGFSGGAFDGEYVYITVSFGGSIVRFDAKTPRSMPSLPQFHGSFF
jgi:hypothetical protein